MNTWNVQPRGCGCAGPLAFFMIALLAWMAAQDLARLERRIDDIEIRTYGNLNSKRTE
jgi:hypothetical protein